MSAQRPRFSLLSLILIVSLVGLFVAWWRAKEVATQSLSELSSVRSRLEKYEGVLNVAENDRPQAIAVRDTLRQRLRWKWRVYLPPDRDYRLHVTDFDVPEDGILTTENSRPGRTYRATQFDHRGEFTVEYAIYLSRNGWEFGCAVDGQPMIGGVFNNGKDFNPDVDLKYTVRGGSPRVWKAGESALLLLGRHQPINTEGSRPGCCQGFGLWFEDLGPVAETP